MAQLHPKNQICNFCLQAFQCSDCETKLKGCKNCFNETNTQDIYTLTSYDGKVYSLYLMPLIFNNVQPILSQIQQQSGLAQLNSFLSDLKKIMVQQVENTIENWKSINQLYQDCPKVFTAKIKNITNIIYSYNDKNNSIKNQLFEDLLKLDEWKKELQQSSIINPEEIKQSQNYEEQLQEIQKKQFKNTAIKRIKSQQKLTSQKIIRKKAKIQPQAVFYEDKTNTINWKKGVTFSTGQRNLYDFNEEMLLSKTQFYSKMNSLKRKIFQYLVQQNKTPVSLCRLHVDSIYQAVNSTTIANKCIQLVSFKITQIFSFGCYLAMLDWSQAQILKLVKVNMKDKIMISLIDFLEHHENKIETLVLTNNRITEQSIKHLQKASLKRLKNIYLGKNAINGIKARKQLKAVKQIYNFYM